MKAPRLVTLLAMALTAPAAAQDGAGTEAALVLQLSPSPRPVALGGAFVALSQGPLALYHGPAGLSAGPPGAELAYQTLPTDAAAGLAGVTVHLGIGVLGAGLAFVDYGDVIEHVPDETGLVGTPTGRTVGGGEVAVSVGYGVALGALRAGAVIRTLNVDIAGLGAMATSYDVGAELALLGDRMTVAAAVQNMGADVEAGRAAPLPLRSSLGVSLRLVDGTDRRGVVSLEARALRSELDGPSPVTFAAGIEWTERVGGVWLAGRVGYRQREAAGDASNPFAAGGGIRLGRWAVDYAFRPMGPLGATQHLGLAYTPGG